VKQELEQIIKIKTAITFRKLLEISAKNTEIKSYEDIAAAADFRKATVSDIFNAHKASKGTTIFQIVKAMGFSIVEFGKVYDSLTELELSQFKADPQKSLP